MNILKFFKSLKAKREIRLRAEVYTARQRLLATPLYVPKWLKDKLEADPAEMAIFNYIHYGTTAPDPAMKKMNECEFLRVKL
jgi:hypothetical protein